MNTAEILKAAQAAGKAPKRNAYHVKGKGRIQQNREAIQLLRSKGWTAKAIAAFLGEQGVKVSAASIYTVNKRAA